MAILQSLWPQMELHRTENMGMDMLPQMQRQRKNTTTLLGGANKMKYRRWKPKGALAQGMFSVFDRLGSDRIMTLHTNRKRYTRHRKRYY